MISADITAWNFDMSQAPRDRPIWLASATGKEIVTRSQWSEKRNAWEGFADREQPMAWAEYIVPLHPFKIMRGEAA